MKEHIDVAKDFIDFISESPTKYHAIENVKSKLLQHKFESLSIDEKWDLKPHGRYFIEQDNSALIGMCTHRFTSFQSKTNSANSEF